MSLPVTIIYTLGGTEKSASVVPPTFQEVILFIILNHKRIDKINDFLDSVLGMYIVRHRRIPHFF